MNDGFEISSVLGILLCDTAGQWLSYEAAETFHYQGVPTDIRTMRIILFGQINDHI